jgi:hypothetical protein
MITALCDVESCSLMEADPKFQTGVLRLLLGFTSETSVYFTAKQSKTKQSRYTPWWRLGEEEV